MITKLGKRTDKLSNNPNKEIENMKKSHSGLKNTITKMKNIREGMNSRLLEAGKRISVMEDREQHSNQAEEQREKIISKNKKMLSDLCDNSK